LVEAYELLEMFCDLLLARMGLIQQMKALDEGIEEAINTVLWAAPRLQVDVLELKVIADQLTAKYGKPFADACREDQLGKVNPKLKHKLSVHAPPKILVEKYMVEIARSHNVPFVPDPNVMRDDEIATAEAMLIDFQNQGANYGNQAQFQPNPTYGYPPPPPTGGAPPSYGGGGGGTMAPGYPGPPPQQPAGYKPFNYPNLKQPSPTEEKKMPPQGTGGHPSAPPPQPPNGNGGGLNLPEVPTNHLPPPPAGGNSGGGGGAANSGDDMDFDDLSRRFEELKKRR